MGTILNLSNISTDASILQEMKRCVTELGFSGFEIGSHVGAKNLDCSDFDMIYKVCHNKQILLHEHLCRQTALDLNTSLFVHPWDMNDWNGRMDKYWLPWLVGKCSCRCL